MAAAEGGPMDVYNEILEGNRVPKVQCLICNIIVASKTRFVEHCNTQHSNNDRVLGDPRIVRCHGCQQYFNGNTGLISHQRRNAVCRSAAPLAVEAVGGVEEPNYTEHELMAPFGIALYHIHREWEDPF